MVKTITLVDERQEQFFNNELAKVYQGHLDAAQGYQERIDRLNYKLNKIINVRDQYQALADDQNGRAQAILDISISDG